MSDMKCPEQMGYIKLDSDSLAKFLKIHPQYNKNGMLNLSSCSVRLKAELDRTRKALDAALDKLKRIQKIYTNAPFNAPINYANVCTDMYDVATEQIKESANE